MISEFQSFFRLLSRPLRREFWWPKKAKSSSERGLILVTLRPLDELQQEKLDWKFSDYRFLEVIGDGFPKCHVYEHSERETSILFLYRMLHFFRHCSTRFSKETSFSSLLAESDGLSRLRYHLASGGPYFHLSELRSAPLVDLLRIKRLLKWVESRHYELWVYDRGRNRLMVPPSQLLPESSISFRECQRLLAGFEDLSFSKSVDEPDSQGRVTRAEGFRAMTYNIHSGIGLDGRYQLSRIAEVLHRYQPDFVALQELDNGCKRSLGEDQLDKLRQLWPSVGQFFPLLNWQGGAEYGIGFLSRHPVSRVNFHQLPRGQGVNPEPRGLIEVGLELENGRAVNLFSCHLGLSKLERIPQVETILKLTSGLTEPSVLLGDFNCSVGSPEYKLLGQVWKESQAKPLKTWFSSFPLRCLDDILVSEKIQVQRIFCPRDYHSRLASDHLPLVADLELG